MDPQSPALVSVADLTVEISSPLRERRVGLRRVSLALAAGEIVTLAGETGSGNSLLAQIVGGHVDRRARRLSGSLSYEGKRATLRRGRLTPPPRGHVATVGNGTDYPLPPDWTVGDWLGSLSRRSRTADWRDAFHAAGFVESDELLEVSFGDLDPLSQARLGVARALLTGARLLVSEEVERELDPVGAATWRELLQRVRSEFGLAILHSALSLRGIEAFADRVLVFFEGSLLEGGDAAALALAPRYRYTREFLACEPRLFPPLAERPAGISREAVREAEEAVAQGSTTG